MTCTYCYCKKTRDLSHKICCNCKNRQAVLDVKAEHKIHPDIYKPQVVHFSDELDNFRSFHHRNPTALEVYAMM